MKKVSYIAIDKRVSSLLPKKRAYNTIEALISVSIDIDNLIHKTGIKPETEEEAIRLLLSNVSISAYASLWRWSRWKTRKFLYDLSTSNGYIVNRKPTGNRHPVSLIIKGLQDITDRKPTLLTILNTKKESIRDFDLQDKEGFPLSFERFIGENNQNHLDREKTLCIAYFLDKFARIQKDQHPHLKPNQWQEAIDTIFNVKFDDGNKEIDSEQCKRIIDVYFEKKYQVGCDYHLPHFLSEGIKKNLFYEELY